MAIDFSETSVGGELSFSTFGCDVYAGDYPTPDRVTPDVTVVRDFYGSGKLEFPDGYIAEIWGFSDPLSKNPYERGKPFPSTTIRVRQGQVVHTAVKVAKNTHTIHHHGIEPTTFNDGVGHLSFEIKGEYTYQWQARHAGTFFYHCHKNTVLHVQKGMYGLLIVDPPSGPGTVFEGGPAYDVEGCWIFDDIDRRWHKDIALGAHDAGLCGEDVGLNLFEPQYFICTGVTSNRTMSDPRTVVNARVGQRVLLRVLNASYSILRFSFPFDVTIVAVDSRGLGRPDSPWSKPISVPRNTPIEMTSAQRFDIMFTPTSVANYRIRTQFLHWITRAVHAAGLGVVNTAINVRA